MSDELPSATPQESGNKNSADKKTSEKGASNPQKNFVTPNKNKRTKPEASLTITGFFVVLIEISGLVLWQMADIFHDWKCDLVHWLSIDCFVAGAAIAAHKALNHPKQVWISYTVICGVIGIIIFSNSRSLPINTAKSNPVEDSTIEWHPTENPTENVSPTVETNTSDWLPPELPDGCSNVIVWIGAAGLVLDIKTAEFFSETGGVFPIKEIPDYLRKVIFNSPDYSPRKRDAFLHLWATMKEGDMQADMPIMPYVVSNRLFIYAKIPFLKERRKIILDDTYLSTITQKLPRLWDYNYSTNSDIFEIVNEKTNPVLQVFYMRPNEAVVFGVFIFDTNNLMETFGGQPKIGILEMNGHEKITKNTKMVTINLGQTNMFVIGTNPIGDVITNSIYETEYPDQKAIFKYPSNIHLGEFADWFAGLNTNSP